MTEQLVADQVEVMGPVGYLIVEFPGNQMTGEGFPLLLDLVDRGLIRIIDFAFVMRDDDGTVRAAELRDYAGGDQPNLAIFEGASSGLLDADDIAEGGAVIQPGSSAALLVYENRWAAPFVSALRRGGAELVAAGFIPQEAILASLDALESSTH